MINTLKRETCMFFQLWKFWKKIPLLPINDDVIPACNHDFLLFGLHQADMPGPGSTLKKCVSCSMPLNVACKTCKYCKAAQPHNLRLKKKIERFDLKSETWAQAQKKNNTSSHLRDDASLLLERFQALGSRGVLFISRPGTKSWTCEVLMPRCKITEAASACLKRMEALFEFVVQGWSQSEKVTASAAEIPQPPVDNSLATSSYYGAPTLATPTLTSANLAIPTPPAPTLPIPTPPAPTLPIHSPQAPTILILTPPAPTLPIPTPPVPNLPISTPPAHNRPISTPPAHTLPIPTPPGHTFPISTPPAHTLPIPTPPVPNLPISTPPAHTLPIPTPPAPTLPIPTPPGHTLPISTPPAPTLDIPTPPAPTLDIPTPPAPTPAIPAPGGNKRKKKNDCSHSSQEVYKGDILKERVKEGRKEYLLKWHPCSLCGKKWRSTWVEEDSFLAV
ncbi:uncharacterized protein [Misgurnus anguillicaudatus]|uniref:uncharacterized protein n=1 Tax=Misgurnus anguillicaudatus TaxID=75329 RepID=UPI003CCEFB1B